MPVGLSVWVLAPAPVSTLDTEEKVYQLWLSAVFMFGINMLIQRHDLRTRREHGKETGKALILPKLLDVLSV